MQHKERRIFSPVVGTFNEKKATDSIHVNSLETLESSFSIWFPNFLKRTKRRVFTKLITENQKAKSFSCFSVMSMNFELLCADFFQRFSCGSNGTERSGPPVEHYRILKHPVCMRVYICNNILHLIMGNQQYTTSLQTINNVQHFRQLVQLYRVLKHLIVGNQ